MSTIEPADVAKQLKFEIDDATDFCADLMEEVNDHNVSGALRAIAAADWDLACEFIRLEAEQEKAGELTPALQKKRDALLARLEDDDADESEDEDETEEE